MSGNGYNAGLRDQNSNKSIPTVQQIGGHAQLQNYLRGRNGK